MARPPGYSRGISDLFERPGAVNGRRDVQCLNENVLTRHQFDTESLAGLRA